MSGYFIIASFKLHEGQLENWKELSKNIDKDIAKADRFISRDSGIDAEGTVYCLVKWKDKAAQEVFFQQLMSGENSEEMMAHFGSVADMSTDKRQKIVLF